MTDRAKWAARRLISGEWVLVYPTTIKTGAYMKRVDAGGHFMLADIVEQARRALAE